MNALAQGYKEGHAYLSRYKLGTITLVEYRGIGRTSVQQRYTRETTKKRYLQGWWSVSEQFQTLFRVDAHDTLVVIAKLKQTIHALEAHCLALEPILRWRVEEQEFFREFHTAYSCLEEARNALSDSIEIITKKEQEV